MFWEASDLRLIWDRSPRETCLIINILLKLLLMVPCRVSVDGFQNKNTEGAAASGSRRFDSRGSLLLHLVVSLSSKNKWPTFPL